MNNIEESKNNRITALMSLLVVVSFWGAGFVFLAWVNRIPTFTVMTIRFLSSTIIIGLVFFKRLKFLNKEYLIVGGLMGVFMFMCYTCATVGIKYTTASNTAFFTCLSAILVPYLNWLFFKKKPTKRNFLCVKICFVGVVMISLGQTMSFSLNSGDLICLGASLFGSLEILVIDRYMKDKDPILLSIVELGAIAVLSIIGIFIFNEPIADLMNGNFGFTKIEVVSLIFLSLGCTAIAFICKTFGQKYIPANRASLILTLEPVLGCIFSAILLKENMGLMGYAGAIVITLSIVISENQDGEGL